jgi:amino acid transporter
VTAVGAADGPVAPFLPGSSPAPSPRTEDSRPIGTVGFLGVVIASLGGPLALAALYAPTIVDDTTASAGFVTIAAEVVFGLPLLVWLRYSKHIASSGGLYAFVKEAAGPRVAIAQAVLWIVS